MLAAAGHLVAICFVGFIAYIAGPGSSTFSWHPTMLATAFVFFMLEGILVLSPKVSPLKGSSHLWKVRVHWICMLLAFASLAFGMASITKSKDEKGKEHFTTLHGKLGGLTNISTFIQCLAGVGLLYPKLITKMLGLTLGKLKKLHATSGTVIFTLAMVSVSLGLNSDWFVSVTSLPVRFICLAAPWILWLLVVSQVRSRYFTKFVQS